MLHLWNKLPIILLCAIAMSSCDFVDLRPIKISIEPGKTDSLLPDPFSPVILKFDTEMDKYDAEGILQISSDLGTMRGDRFWRGNNLYFVPISGWTAGIRYTLSLIGTIRAVDGREIRLERFISFYAVNRNYPPLLKWYSPSNGESVGTGDVVLEFHFSRSMDRLTVESALTIEGIGNKIYEWLSNDQILKVIPDKSFSPWISCRWNLKDAAKSADGVPLPKAYSGYFTTDLDQTIPEVKKVFPVLYADGCWFPTGADIETGLGSGHGIAVEFNKSMGESVLRSLSFEPSLSGRTEFLSEKSVVYVFTRDPEPETTYTLIVSSDTKDSTGLKTGTDYRINFVPDTPYLKILSFLGAGGRIIENLPEIINAVQVNVNPGTGELFFSIRFSLGFSMEEKQNAAQKITISPFFPRTLAPVALQYVNWISDDSLYMCWEGLTVGDGENFHYYKLTIPGGKGGITSGRGNYMKEDIILFLEAIR